MITACCTLMPSRSSARERSARRISAETSTGFTTRPPSTRNRTTPDSPSPNLYGLSRRVSGSADERPMNRLTLTMVSRGKSAASLRAARPTTTEPGPPPSP